MFWQEDEDKTLPRSVPDDVVDVSFRIRCKQLPPDHAHALSEAVRVYLPWIGTDRFSGVHSIHVAGSANGWQRPEDNASQLLMLSRRTRMMLRIPKECLDEALALSGKVLDISNYPLAVEQGKEKPLQNAAVIFSRYVLSDENESENDFLNRIALEIKAIADFNVKKMLCGKTHYLSTPQGKQLARHLMIADLDSEVSIRIQQYGLGTGRDFGCGLFLPHKGIKTLKPTE